MCHKVLGLDQEALDQELDTIQGLLEESLRAINQLKLQEVMEVEPVVWGKVVWYQEVLDMVAWALEDWEQEVVVESPLNQVMAI